MAKQRRADKNVATYMSLPYTYEVTPNPSGAFVASVKELPGCMSQGDTIEHATSRLRELMKLWFSVCLEDGTEIPVPEDTKKYSGR